MSESNYLFVIDTENYAGNFEREMCAYLTGATGDCGVGEEFAQMFNKDFEDKAYEMFENVISVMDDRGCARPVTIWPTPGWANDGMGGHYKLGKEGSKSGIKAYIKSCEAIYGDYMKAPQQHLKDLLARKNVEQLNKIGWTVASCKREIKRHQAEIDKARKIKKLKAFPAYLSVGIWFYSKPTTEEIAIMKERASKFAEAKRNNPRFSFDKDFKLKITGFRLLTMKKKCTEEAV